MASRPPTARSRPALVAPLLGGDQDAVRDVLADALRSGRSRCAVYETLVIPCLHEIGLLWEHGEISVPDEHLASDSLTRVLTDLRSTPVADADAPTAVVSCAPLEGHTLPALLADDLLTDAGWRVWHMGSSAPPAQLAAFVQRREPQLLVLTSTLTRTVAGIAAVTRALQGPGRPAVLAAGEGVRHIVRPAVIGADALGRRLADLLAFAGLVSTGRVPGPDTPRPAALRRPPAGLLPEQVEVALQEAGTALTINEIGERCGATVGQVGTALTLLERAHRVRFTGGRWTAIAERA